MRAGFHLALATALGLAAPAWSAAPAPQSGGQPRQQPSGQAQAAFGAGDYAEAYATIRTRQWFTARARGYPTPLRRDARSPDAIPGRKAAA